MTTTLNGPRARTALPERMVNALKDLHMALSDGMMKIVAMTMHRVALYQMAIILAIPAFAIAAVTTFIHLTASYYQQENRFIYIVSTRMGARR